MSEDSDGQEDQEEEADMSEEEEEAIQGDLP